MLPREPGKATELLVEVAGILTKHNVPYLVIGALAAAYYGVVRASLDADALISLPNESNTYQALTTEFQERALLFDRRDGDLFDPITGIIKVNDQHGNQVDLLLGIRGMLPESFKRARSATVLGRSLTFVGLEDFIAMKIYAGGEQDIQDVVGALKVSGHTLDRELLRKIVANFGPEEAVRCESLLREHKL